MGDIKNYLPVEQGLHDKIIEAVDTYNVTEAGDMMIMGILVRSENVIGLLPEYGIDKNDSSLLSIPLTDSTTTNYGFAISKNINIKKLVNVIKSSFKAFAKINHFNSKLYK